MQYDLLTEPWMPVTRKEAGLEQLSLLDVFQDAHRLSGFSHNNPLALAAMMRLLIAILHRVYRTRGGKEWQQLFEKGEFPLEVCDYLKTQMDRFDLFSETHPFFQIPNLTKDKANSVKKLSPEFATANNKTLFSHLADDQAFSLSSAESAINLLVCQYFSLGGGISGSTNLYGKHSNYANAPLVGGAVVYVQGKNLFETLMLNLGNHKKNLLSDQDKPIWERDVPEKLQPRTISGMSDYLTWPSRYLRLLPDEKGQVSELYIAQGLSTPNEVEREPYFAYKPKKDGGVYPLGLRFDRELWRDSAAIYYRGGADTASQSEDRRPYSIRNIKANGRYLRHSKYKGLSCQVLALENNKANPKAWFSQRLPVNVLCLLDDDELMTERNYGLLLQKAISQSEGIFISLKESLRLFASNCLIDGAKREDVTRLLESYQFEREYWSQLDQKFIGFFDQLIAVPEKAVSQWNADCKKTAKNTFKNLMSQLVSGAGREYQACALATNALNQSLFGKNGSTRHINWKKSSAMDQSIEDFVKYLCVLNSKQHKDKASLAHLRRTLSDDPKAWVGAMPYLAKHWPKSEKRAEVFALVAGLYASHLKHERRHLNFGDSLSRLWRKEGQKPSGSLDLRVKTLLEADDEQIPIFLRSLFQILKSKEISVDYVELTNDLLQWQRDDKRTQLEWGRFFWAPPKIKQSEEETKQGED